MRPQPVEQESIHKFWRQHFPDKKMPSTIEVYDFLSEEAYQKFLVWYNDHKEQGEMVCEVCEKQRSKAFYFRDTGELKIFTAPGPFEGDELRHLLSHMADSLKEQLPYIG
jgi:hypothetical protein